MITGLRLRLFLSYLLIIVVTLLVIVVALFFVLRGQPLLTETASTRLYNLLAQISLIQDNRNVTIPQDGPSRIQKQILNQLDKRLNVRIIVFDKDQTVLFDTRHDLKEGSQLNMESVPYNVSSTQSVSDIQTIRGVLQNPNGDWIFVAQAPNSSASAFIMVTIKAPRSLSVQETIQYYGQELLAPLLQAGLIGLAAAFLMSLVITRSVAEPLQQVAKAASAVAAGQLDQPAPIKGPREVRIVAEAFNQMTAEVKATQQAQRDFLANVTHDLRTPLTSIQGFSQAIIEGVANNPTAAQRAAQIIHEEAERMTRMVQELLDLAKIEAGRFSMTRHSVKLSELLNRLGERLTPRAVEKGLSLTVNIPDLPLIAGDGDRLVQVYTNLVENAIKHTPSGGTIAVRAAPYEAGILAMVSDTGEGIPTEDIPHIFDRFYQVDKSRQRNRRDGAGLGLAIAKGIVDAHGGKIWAESKEGQGTIFYTWFPALASDTTTLIARRHNNLFKPTK